jgi:hypothetical protein
MTKVDTLTGLVHVFPSSEDSAAIDHSHSPTSVPSLRWYQLNASWLPFDLSEKKSSVLVIDWDTAQVGNRRRPSR